MLELQTFKTIIEHTPLVSIDICLVSDNQMLMCKRNFNPLKGEWFTPGGRIYKNETWQNALIRIVNVELGMKQIDVNNFLFLGVWDHLYENSFFDESISTHYVNLPHYSNFRSKPYVILDNQHSEFKWVNLSEIVDDKSFHSYMRNYSLALLSILDKEKKLND
tara:strand:- start:17960 stop:18448 length:489 start_codon:yes stop_codon:yes gene_type:complete